MSHWNDLTISFIRDRRWLVALDIAQPAASLAKQLINLGAEDVLAIASTLGVGPMVDFPEEKLIITGLEATSGRMHGIRAAEACINELNKEIVAQVQSWDPEGQARAVRAFFSEGKPVAGRAVFGARPAAWQALEDKVVVDALWDAAGVARASYAVVAPSDAPEAAKGLDEGSGTVWAGDAKAGFNGGATYTFWVRNPEDANRALAFLSHQCDRVRVMPFLDGLPCSIHAMIAPGDDHIVVLRPMELLVLRSENGFVYSGTAGRWRAGETERDEMRSVARKVGEHLREHYSYRGAFTVDGVMTAQGFLPNELNPRFGAAMSPYAGKDMPLLLLNYGMIEGLELDWRMKNLEQELLSRSLRPMNTRCGMPMEGTAPEKRSQNLVFDPLLRLAEAEEEAHAIARFGPRAGGSYLQMIFQGEHTPIGPPLAPRVAQVINWAREAWDLPVETVSPAPNAFDSSET
jgi:hypothetical protein